MVLGGWFLICSSKAVVAMNVTSLQGMPVGIYNFK
jgi:hypothetical protein